TIELDGQHHKFNLNNGSYPRENEGYFPLDVCSKNVLNNFNSPFSGDPNNYGSNRGASDIEEFELQQAKIIEALYRM
ncbi:hypothetical protein, partial [Salmonella enterica]|uniref:hypothetical protein n=1 Tax=Salmonella enterica TaxID=28901 RepID=UPI0032B62402